MKVFTQTSPGTALKRLCSLVLLFALSAITSVSAQTSSQTFGTGTATNTSTTGSTATIPNPTGSGTTYARGGNGGSVNIVNTTNLLGSTGSYLRAAASTGGAVVKASPWVSYTGGTSFYTSMKVMFGNSSGAATATSGIWTFHQGAGAMYSNNNDLTGAEVFASVRFTFGAGGAIAMTYRANTSYINTGLTTSTLSSATVYHLELVGNNQSSGPINYNYAGNPQSVAAGTFDFYIDGVLVGNDLAKATLPAGTNINAGTFIGSSSTSAVANLFADDVITYNSVPASIGTPANPPAVTSETFTGNVGTSFSHTVQATNSPSSYALTGTLPAGLGFNTSTGAITGTPTVATTETVSVTATNGAGTSDPADITIQIDPGNQTISFDPISDKTFGDADFNLSATASSGLPITYFTSNPFVATVSGNTVSIVGAGSVTITATQEGDLNYNAAADVERTFTVNKASQVITFNALPDKSTADADFQLTASSTSGLPISYSSSDVNVATITAPDILHIVGPGNTTITASQAGNDNYLPATSVDQNQFISNASLQNQTITFPPIADATYGDAPVAPGATASSGLTVTYSSDNNDVATVSGNTLIITGVGTATITASQAGDAAFNPAPDEVQTITVNAKQLTVSGVVANDKIYDGTTLATLDISGGLLGGVVGGDDVTLQQTTAEFVSPNAGPGIMVTPNLVLGGADAGNYTLQQPFLTADINPAPQVITFNPLPAANTNTTPIDLDTYASVNSPLALSYFSSDDNVASVSGNILTINGPGTATITAIQNGGGNYAAATPIDQSITVTLAPAVVMWNFGTDAAAPYPSSGLPVNNLDVSAFQAGNDRNTSNNFVLQFYTNSNSPTPAFSGLYNVGITAYNVGFNPMSSAYYQFTITPDAGYQVTLSDLSFGSRSTSSGPTELAIRTSADGFVNNIATLSPSANSAWVLQTPSFTPITSSTPLTVRIYGYVPGGSGSVGTTGAANWRIDDVSFEALVEAQAGCTGTPEAGSISALDDEFCGSGGTDITATGFTDPGSNPGVSLQWYSSTNNVDFAPVDGATSATLVTGTLSQTTYYYLQVSCSGSGLSDVSNTQTITINAVPAAPSISGTATICAGGTTTLTSSAAPAGGSYAWFNNGNPIAPTTQAISVGAGSYTVVITSAEGCVSASSAAFEVTELGAPSAPFVEGPKNVCQYVGTGEQVVYTVFPDPNVTSYNWVVPPTVNIVSGQGTGTLTVTFLNGFIQLANKQLRVTGTTACGNTPMSIKYLVAQLPIVPSPISGPTNVCELVGTSTLATYSVPEVPGASDYNWTLPPGVTLVNDNGNSIDVTFSNAFVSSVISVNAANDCGVSGNRSLTVNKVSPSTPGPITGSNNACLFMPTASNPAGTPTTFSVLRASNVTAYNWSVPAGVNITNQTQTATEDIITVQFTSGFTSGSVSVTASNNCGVSAARTLALVVFKPATPSPIDVVQMQSCPGRMFSYTLAGVPANTLELEWTVPSGGTIVSGQGTSSIAVTYADGPIAGNVTVTGVNGCGSSATRSVAVKLAGCPPAPKKVVEQNTAITGVEVEVLDAGIFPNPSTTDFRLKVRSTAKENVQVRVFNATGVAQTKMIVTPGETISFGQDLKPGTYFVEVMQGKERKVSRIVKL